MGGLASVFKKLIPFLIIICLVTFGINIIFGNNLTYLSKQTINGTEIWKFNFTKYLKNINFNNLKSAVTNVIDIKGFQQQINSFKAIWNNGYQLGDGIKTIIGVIILVIDGLITALNMVLVPIRLIAGLLLTALNILGIDISNNDNPVIYLLKVLLKLYRNTNNGIEPLIPIIKWNMESTSNILVTTVPVISTTI